MKIKTMTFFKLLAAFTFLLIMSSCNEEKIKQLENENTELADMVDDLVMDLETKLVELEEAQEELEVLNERFSELSVNAYSNNVQQNFCEEQFKAYKYGKNISITRYDKALGRQVTIYGAENIIDFLNRHYSPN